MWLVRQSWQRTGTALAGTEYNAAPATAAIPMSDLRMFMAEELAIHVPGQFRFVSPRFFSRGSRRL
jgi:hypothetical protein